MIERAVVVFLMTWIGSLRPAAAQEPAPHLDSIRREHLEADLFFLASDEMRGRLAGSPENRLAAAFIRSRFERLGLAPAGPEGSYYQSFDVTTAALGEENRFVITTASGASLRLRPGQDYFPLRESASGWASGRAVFAGYGIRAPELSHDDYRDTELEGKVALVLEHEPGERDPGSPFDGIVASERARRHRKILAAQDKGAAAILFVRDVHNHSEPEHFQQAARGYWPEEPPRIDRYTLAEWVERIRIPAAQISPALAEHLLDGTGRSLDELSRAAEAPGGISPIELPGADVEMETSVLRTIVTDRNVVALVEGSDPDLRDEWVIVCAHYDHDGADGRRVFNGADDDGSGTVGLLEIAEAYALAAGDGERPRRSVLLAAWNFEERGLLGAWAYAERPLVPLARTVAVLNMDMIGRDEEVREGGGRRFRGLALQSAEENANAVNLLGTTRSAELRAEAEKANQGIGLELKMRYDNNESNLLRRSDHWPFLVKGVPALFIHTGLHPDYHMPEDRPEKIRYDKMEKIVRLVYQLSWNLARSDGRPSAPTAHGH